MRRWLMRLLYQQMLAVARRRNFGKQSASFFFHIFVLQCDDTSGNRAQ